MAPSMRYLVVRALLFLVPFTVLMIAQVPWWLSLIVSLVFAFAASIVFFSKLRDAAAADVQRMREGRKRAGAGPDDADIEDAALGEPAPRAEAAPTATDGEPEGPAAPAVEHPGATGPDADHGAAADPRDPDGRA
jgi:hypothetical protein